MKILLQTYALGMTEIYYKMLIEKSDITNRNFMMQHCNSCPKEIGGVWEFLLRLEAVSDKEEFKYKQWVFVDGCNLGVGRFHRLALPKNYQTNEISLYCKVIIRVFRKFEEHYYYYQVQVNGLAKSSASH